MISAFRIVSQQWRQEALTGKGSRLYGGRWNPPGFSCLYLAESRALAALEMLCHLTPETRGIPFVLIELRFPKLWVSEIPCLPDDWDRWPTPTSTRQLGRQWLEARKTPVCRVPSVIMKEEYNYLVNTDHPKFAEVEIADERIFSFDSRIVTT